MTIKIKNIEGKELFSFETNYVSTDTIADVLNIDSWKVSADMAIHDYGGEPWIRMYWCIKCKDNKRIMLSFDSSTLGLYTIHLFEGQGVTNPETWEEVMEWGR